MSFPGVSRQRRIMTVCCLTTAKASSSSRAWSSTGGGVVVILVCRWYTAQVPGRRCFCYRCAPVQRGCIGVGVSKLVCSKQRRLDSSSSWLLPTPAQPTASSRTRRLPSREEGRLRTATIHCQLRVHHTRTVTSSPRTPMSIVRPWRNQPYCHVLKLAQPGRF
jgi:hypothetical protein